MSVKCNTTSLPGIIQMEPDVFKDDRGFFMEIQGRPGVFHGNLPSKEIF